MNKNILAALAVGVFACGAQLQAADITEEHTVNTGAEVEFNSKINTWAEGTITGLDAEHGKLTIHGAKRPYATAYAQMTNEIIQKTKGLRGAEKLAKESDIRNSWRDKLAKAQRQPFDRDSDFTFNLPKNTNVVTTLDESRHYGQDLQTLPAAPRGMEEISDREAASLITLKKLDIGEHVVVGYDAGMISNDVYAVLKANYRDLTSPAANTAATADEKLDGRSASNEKNVKPDNTAVNKRDRNTAEPTADQQKQNTPDIELTRNIRRAIVKDDSLSTYAHNVKIITQNGNVTLKGPVNTNEEKANIEKKALDVAGEGHVTNQIDVLP